MASSVTAKGQVNKRIRQGSTEDECTSFSCQKCNSEVQDKINCTGCKLNYCLNCAGISQVLYQCMKNGELVNFHWTCDCCKSMFPTLENIAGAVHDIQNKHDQRMKTLEDRMDKLETATKDEIKSSIVDMKSDILDSLKVDLDSIVDKRNRELEDRKRRELNITVFNLEEHSNQTGLENKAQDEEDIRRICSSIGVEEVEIVTFYRLGKKIQNKTRPIKIILSNKAQRKAILNNAKHISSKAAPEFRRVIFGKDLTPIQRDERRKRISEIKSNKHKTNPQLDKQEGQNVNYRTRRNSHSPVAMEFAFTAPSPVMIRDGILSQINPTEDSQLETQLSQPYDDSTILGDNTIIGGHFAGNSAAETDVQPQINSDF